MMDPRQRLKVLRDDWLHCTRCALHEIRGDANIVFGAGSASATYFFLYEVPSEADEALGSPLQGDAGTIFSDLLHSAGIEKKDCYAAPLVACRPRVFLEKTEDSPERWVPRASTKEEVETCRSRVHQQIYAVDPIVIFSLGDLPWKFLVPPKGRGLATKLETAIGDIFVTHVPGHYSAQVPYPVIPLPSMDYLLKNPSVALTGPITLATKHLIKGRRHAEYLKAQSEKDAQRL